jgi:hypothetical protein
VKTKESLCSRVSPTLSSAIRRLRATYPVTPTVHVPFSRRSPLTITLTGTVSSGAKRDKVMQLVKQVAMPYDGDDQIDDRLLVDPQMIR